LCTKRRKNHRAQRQSETDAFRDHLFQNARSFDGEKTRASSFSDASFEKPSSPSSSFPGAEV